MAKFEPGHKLAKGGARPGAGRKSKSVARQRQNLARIGWAALCARASDLMDTYLGLACGREVERYDESGNFLYRETVVDAPTTRHAVDRFLSAAQKVELNVTEQAKRVFSFELPGIEGGEPVGIINLEESETGRIDAKRAFGFTLGEADHEESDSESQRAASLPAVRRAASAPVAQEIVRGSDDDAELDESGIERPAELIRDFENFVGAKK